MGAFEGGVRRRVDEARAALRSATEADDQHGMQVYAADLEEVLRLAAEHGVRVDLPAAET
ncbi:hypothetical protein [Nonomuraea phyllanthi]|uniref:hypothetical protein n=1 Tax=Nonomuraea phyllanthi TaxID=2219224 RepID=UPI00186AC055|nr:hypothetical protein [Nonomuraea phyllanthi]